MKLPNNELSIVKDEKILNYLLNDTHIDGKSKSKFFKLRGFKRVDIETFRTSLIQHAIDNDVINIQKRNHGTVYTIIGNMPTPDGRNPNVLTVWIIKYGYNEPRLVSAYPQL